MINEEASPSALSTRQRLSVCPSVGRARRNKFCGILFSFRKRRAELGGALIILTADGGPEPCDPIKFPKGAEQRAEDEVEGNDKI